MLHRHLGSKFSLTLFDVTRRIKEDKTSPVKKKKDKYADESEKKSKKSSTKKYVL